jgi:hypothetical protein
MNLCKDCSSFRLNPDNPEASTCHRKVVVSAVTGKFLPIFCNTERLDWGTCKPEGIHFRRTATQEEIDADREMKSREWERWIDVGDIEYERANRRLGI